MNKVEIFLNNNGIDYIKHTHPAVFTCEESEKYCKDIPGIASKNLFLQDEKKKRFFLVIIPDYKRANLKDLAVRFGVKKLSFSSPESLKKFLNLSPGSVSPFGLINDKDSKVELFIDLEIWNSPIVQFHPNDNRATLELPLESFKQFLSLLNIEPQIMTL